MDNRAVVMWIRTGTEQSVERLVEKWRAHGPVGRTSEANGSQSNQCDGWWKGATVFMAAVLPIKQTKAYPPLRVPHEAGCVGMPVSSGVRG